MKPFTGEVLRTYLWGAVIGILVWACALFVALTGGLVQAQEAAIPYPEGGTDPVATFSATDDEDDKAGKALKWAVRDTTASSGDAAYFSISEAGVLSFKKSPDYENAKNGGSDEAANTYEITVVAIDSDMDEGMHPIVVEVTNEDEPGMLTLSNRQPVDGVEITATLTDEDGGTSSLGWQWARGSSPSGSFTDIEVKDTNGAKTASYTPAPADIGSYLRVTVTYTDPAGSGKEESAVTDHMVVASRSSNAAPVIVDSEGDAITDAAIIREVDENSPAGTPVGGPILVSNAENDVLTFKLSSTDAGKFDIDSNGQITVGEGTELDTEDNTKTGYSVIVTVEDGNFRDSSTATDYSDSITVTINAENVLEDPKLAGKTSVDHAENIATPVATYVVTDDEDDAASTAVGVKLSGVDADAFTLTDTADAGGTANDGTWELAFKAVLDFEAPADVGGDNTYNITVTAKDSSDRTDVLDVVVMITNVEEDGTVELSTLVPKVGVELTATLTGDDDGVPSGITWKWERADDTDFDGDDVVEIVGATSAAYTPVHADAGKYLRATAMYTDPQGSDSASEVSANTVVGSNRAPTFDNPATADTDESDDISRNVTEDTFSSTGSTSIGDPITAYDPDDSDSLTYALSGDAAPFSINRSDGQISLRVGQRLDYEMQDEYVVMVTATDPDRESATVMVTIKVGNHLEEPVVTGKGEVEFAEHTPMETAVATFSATDDEDDKAGKALKWAVRDTTASSGDAAYFSISEAGVLSFKKSPDYENAKNGGSDEAANTYEITVVAIDSDMDEGMHPIVVEVTNEDEPGMLTLSNRQPVDGVEITATLTDEDGGTSSLGWQWARGSSPSGSFTDIEVKDTNGAKTASYTPAPADIGSYLRVTVTYTDPAGSGKEESAVTDHMVVASRSSNAAPVIVDSEGDAITDAAIIREVDENSPAGTPVGGPILVSNAENDVLTFKLSSTDAGKFDIDSNGQITVGEGTELDTEDNTKTGYSVIVTVEDGNFRDSSTATDYSDSITVTINAENVLEDPKLAGKTSVDHAENIATPVATYVVTDDEDDAASTAVGVKLSGVDADAFTLTDTADAGGTANDGTWELAFKAVLDFEAPADVGGDNTYNITVTAKDSSDRTDVLDVVVMITNVEEDGTVELSTLVPKVGVELTATLTGDDDGVPSGITWKWERADDTDFDGDDVVEIVGATSAAYTPVHADAGKYLRATAMYTDPQGSDSASEVSANTVVGSNRAPMFEDDPSTTELDESKNRELSLDEGKERRIVVIVGTVAAVDPDTGETGQLTYALSGDAAPFSIERSTGRIDLKAGQALDYETQDEYVVMVTATDPSGLSATVTVTIKIGNVLEDPVVMRQSIGQPNRAPTFPSPSTTRSILENTPAGMDISSPVGANDPDNDDLTYTLEGTDAASFDIDDGTGQLLTKADLDRETQSTYMVVVRATDPGGLSATIAVTITVTDVDENQAPEFPYPTQQLSIDENTSAGENIGDPVAATDGDGDTLTYTLGGADMADFDIDPATGQLMTKSPLDYETKSTYTVTVTASDNSGGQDEVTVTITVTDVDETQTLLQRYDTDGSGAIDKSEMIKAINDYLFGTGTDAITKEQMIEVINLYLFG